MKNVGNEKINKTNKQLNEKTKVNIKRHVARKEMRTKIKVLLKLITNVVKFE